MVAWLPDEPSPGSNETEDPVERRPDVERHVRIRTAASRIGGLELRIQDAPAVTADE